MSRREEPKQGRSAILVIGSGNAETILDLDRDLVIGAKHDVIREELFGGSGVNYMLRMTHYDPAVQILPILSIGAGRIGQNIRQAILKAMDAEHVSHGILDYINSEGFFCPGITTPQSTVLTTARARTILRERAGKAGPFRSFVERRLEDVQALADVSVGAVMIGHIYADSAQLEPDQRGQITKSIVDAYRDKAIVFANFGESQYGAGHTFWQDCLEGLTVFQLSIEEARRFFSAHDGEGEGGTGQGRRPWSLSAMMRWFQERRITAVITLDRFGAVATFRGQRGVWLAPAFDLDAFQDATGAGDAFGAGLVYTLCQAGCEITSDLFQTAIKEARMWSAHACTTRGAASQCPSKAELEGFTQALREKGQDPDFIECRELHAWDSIFRILDKAY
jgi:sugar/nucleoside kinase (ribokinase family)